MGLAFERSDEAPCIGCPWSAACSVLQLACARFKRWASEGRVDPRLSREPDQAGYDAVFGGKAKARAATALAGSIKRRAAAK